MPATLTISRAMTLMFFCSTSVLLADEDPSFTLSASIQGTTVDTGHQQIMISGKGFGTAKPAVSIDNIPLNVISFTDTAITAFLPPNLAPGSYLLIVNRPHWPFPVLFISTIGGSGGSGGVQGPAGPAGPQGPPGATGPAGPSGPQGPAGLTWKGPWTVSTSYAKFDAASYKGSTWINTVANNTASPDVANSGWMLLASAGTPGTPGTPGAVGATGPKGDPGPQGPQGIQGVKGIQGANGNPGAPGATGPQGPAGTARAYGLVNADGTTDPSRTVNATAYKQNGTTGTYCIHPAASIDPSTTVLLITGADPVANQPPVLHQIVTVPFAACQASEFIVVTRNLTAGGRTDRAFSFLIP